MHKKNITTNDIKRGMSGKKERKEELGIKGKKKM